VEITSVLNLYSNPINNKKQNKHKYHNKVGLTADSFERTTPVSKTNNVNFKGFWSKEEPIHLDSDPVIMSNRQLRKVKQGVANEIYNLVCGDYTKANSERLDKLLNSPFVDYSLECVGKNGSNSLSDMIFYRNCDKPNPMYEQFFVTSLGGVMPLEEHKEFLSKFYYRYKQIYNTYQAYLNMDENSKNAEYVRNMVKRLNALDIKLPDANAFFAECLLNNKLEMCKVLVDEYKLSPMTKVMLNCDESTVKNVEFGLNKKGFSDKIYKDNKYSSSGGNNQFQVVYDKYLGHYYVPGETYHTLYNIAGLSKFDEAKKFFDMPEYLYQSFYHNTDWNYWKEDTTMFGYGNGTYAINHFFLDYYNDHPEVYSLDFIVSFLSKFVANGVDLTNLSLGFSLNRFRTKEHYNEAFKLLKQLQNDNSDEAQVKKKVLEVLFNNDSNNLLKCVKYLDVEDVNKAQGMKKDEFDKLVQKKFIDYIQKSYDVYNINDWEKHIVDEFKEYVPDKILADFVINNLPDIFYSSSNHTSFKNIIDKLRELDVDWSKVVDEYGNNLAYRAVDAENPLLIDFAKEKQIPFDLKNNAGVSALDSAKKNRRSPVINSLKINSDDLIKFVSKGVISGVKILLTNKVIDVNSVDSNGYSTGMIAARNGDIAMLKLLNSTPGFDINYINPSTLETALSLAKDTQTRNFIKENTDFNQKNSDIPDYKSLFNLLNSNAEVDEVLEVLHGLISNGNLDLNFRYKGVSLRDKISEYAYNKDVHQQNQIHNLLYSEIAGGISKNFLSRTKDIIDENGIMSLSQIQDFINYPNLSEIMNEPLNDMNEPIGFFVADIPVSGDNIVDITEIIDALRRKGYDFSVKNKANQTVLEKSKDAENTFLTEYLESIGVKK